MIVKEKLIFWPLAAVFIGMLVFGFVSQGNKEEATKDLLKEIEVATKKSRAKKKAQEDKLDVKMVKAEDNLDTYELLLKRSPFFRVRDASEIKKVERIPLKKEEPKKVILKYKGRAMMGSKVMVVIEDEGTGKSFFVQEGDMIGDFLVVTIDEKEVALKKKGGEEIILNSSKKEQEKKEKKASEE